MHHHLRCPWLAVSLLLAVNAGSLSAAPPPIKLHETSSGVRFGVLGDKPAKPAATLFILAGSLEDALNNADYNKVGQLLMKDGCLCVSLDVPCHGKDVKSGEATGLSGWRARLEKGDELVSGFAKKASEVLDRLIKDGYTAADRVAVAGTSRGGFMALHWAAAEPRVGWTAAFAPVSDLLVLAEFRGMEKNAPTRSVDLAKQANKLAGRPIWICIGNNDARVGTDQVIAFTRKVVEASAAGKKPAPIEIHVMPSVGHSIHPTAHEEVAAWLTQHWRKAR
jgi:pimeloyl-ACP methyl ester carboxylesterase